MALDAKELENMVRKAFPDAEITLKALIEDGDHYSLAITSSAFKSKSRIEQHKMVYAALEGKMGGILHALQLKTSIPQ